MPLQTMFALYTLLPAITASPVPSTAPEPQPYNFSAASAISTLCALTCVSTTTLHIKGGRTFAATVFAPNSTSSESRYPGAIIIATEDTRDRAFSVANTMATIGVTVIMYVQEVNATHRLLVHDAQAAVDSMRRRYDVRREEIGVIAFEEAVVVVPDLVKDTTLSFAIAASGDSRIRRLNSRYTVAYPATLLVQGVDSLRDPNANRAVERVKTALKQQPQPVITLPPGSMNPVEAAMATRPIQPAAPAEPEPKPAEPQDLMVSEMLDDAAVAPPTHSQMAPNVTVWPVPKEQLETIGEAQSPLGVRVVSWIREQVHANPVVQQAQPITIR